MLERIFLFLTIIFSGLATSFYRSKEGLFTMFFLSLLLFIKNRYTFSKKLIQIFIIWFIYVALLTIKFNVFHEYFAVIIPIKLFIAYVLIKHFSTLIFYKFEKIIYSLSIISLFFWLWQTISPTSLFSTFRDSINLSGDLFHSDKYFNIFVYTVNTVEATGEILIPRNCGFCWEPGPFSSFIVVAMFFNLARTKFSLKKNRVFWILLITLITTQSTTGFFAFFILIIWFVYNNPNYKKKRLLTIPIILGVILYLFVSLPFMQKKIIHSYEGIFEIDKKVTVYSHSDKGWAPDRFASFVIAWQDFIDNPLIGYGGHTLAQWTKKAGANIGVINGLGNIMARYGLFGLSLFLMMLYKSGEILKWHFKYNAGYFWGLIILFLSFGFSLVETPAFITLFIFPFFARSNSIK